MSQTQVSYQDGRLNPYELHPRGSVVGEAVGVRSETISRALYRLREGVRAELHAATLEELQLGRMPLSWTTNYNTLADATGIRSTHGDQKADSDVVMEMVAGNTMGLGEAINPQAHENYVGNLTDDKEVSATEAMELGGEMNDAQRAAVTGIDAIAQHQAVVQNLALSTQQLSVQHPAEM